MTKQQKALLAAQVQRAVEIKNIIGDLTDELDDIKEALDLSGLDVLEVDGAKATKVVQQAQVLDGAAARRILGSRVQECLRTQVKIFWKFG